MTRIQARAAQDRPARRVDDLDHETLRSVQSYFVARAERRELGPEFVAAWERFYAACDPLIHKLAQSRSDQVYNREDRVQDIWCVIVSHLDHYDSQRGLFPTWLGRVIRQELDEQDRSHRRLRRLVSEVEQELPGREEDPAHVHESRESSQRVELVIDELRSHVSETNYWIVHDHWVKEKSFEGIAMTLGFTVKQVRDRHHRAMEKLRDLMGTRE
jgi:RNA polymerase sigma factor (sigma-70 family)